MTRSAPWKRKVRGSCIDISASVNAVLPNKGSWGTAHEHRVAVLCCAHFCQSKTVCAGFLPEFHSGPSCIDKSGADAMEPTKISSQVFDAKGYNGQSQPAPAVAVSVQLRAQASLSFPHTWSASALPQLFLVSNLPQMLSAAILDFCLLVFINKIQSVCRHSHCLLTSRQPSGDTGRERGFAKDGVRSSAPPGHPNCSRNALVVGVSMAASCSGAPGGGDLHAAVP